MVNTSSSNDCSTHVTYASLYIQAFWWGSILHTVYFKLGFVSGCFIFTVIHKVVDLLILSATNFELNYLYSVPNVNSQIHNLANVAHSVILAKFATLENYPVYNNLQTASWYTGNWEWTLRMQGRTSPLKVSMVWIGCYGAKAKIGCKLWLITEEKCFC